MTEEEIKELQSTIEQLHWMCEVLRHDRDILQNRVDNALKLLSGIHSLLYPPPVVTADGRTMVFRPKNIDPHLVLQELSDLIRALPEDMATLIVKD